MGLVTNVFLGQASATIESAQTRVEDAARDEVQRTILTLAVLVGLLWWSMKR